MAAYTQISLEDVTHIASQYNIKVLSFQPIDGGNSNSNYKIRAENGDYMLTLSEEKTLEDIQQLISLLNWLNKHHITTSKVLTTVNGEHILSYQNKPLFIKTWIKGDIQEDLTPTMLQQAGITMAKLHQVPAPSFLPKKDGYASNLFSIVINQNIDSKYTDWLTKRIQFFKNNLPQELPKGLIHGDLFFDNILFEKEKVNAIIDFEEASFYYLTFDIGMAIIGLCRTNGAIDESKINAFIKGYETVRVLDDLEQKSIPLFVQYAAVTTSCWRFWKYNIQLPTPHLKKHHEKMVDVANSVIT